jgi:hypothetical protein
MSRDILVLRPLKPSTANGPNWLSKIAGGRLPDRPAKEFIELERNSKSAIIIELPLQSQTGAVTSLESNHLAQCA